MQTNLMNKQKGNSADFKFGLSELKQMSTEALH